jgi:hypothetical protein
MSFPVVVHCEDIPETKPRVEVATHSTPLPVDWSTYPLNPEESPAYKGPSRRSFPSTSTFPTKVEVAFVSVVVTEGTILVSTLQFASPGEQEGSNVSPGTYGERGGAAKVSEKTDSIEKRIMEKIKESFFITNTLYILHICVCLLYLFG